MIVAPNILRHRKNYFLSKQVLCSVCKTYYTITNLVLKNKHSANFPSLIWTTKLKKALKRVWWPAWFWSKQRRPLTQLNVLLQKLYAVGFSKRAVTWLKSFISNRAFLDNLGNIFSQTASASCSIPQVSIFLWGRGDRRGGSGSCFRIR